jgi:ferredoxin
VFQLGFDQLMEGLALLESRALRVDPQQCSRLRHQRSSCTLCADCCQAQAITWGETLQVDPDKCTGCGICAAVCPTGALEARAPTNMQLLAQAQEGLREGTAIAFACTRVLEARDGDSGRFIPVHCLGRLDESILVGAVCLGAEAVWLIDAACEGCPYVTACPERSPSAQTVATQAVHRANSLLRACGVPERIFIGPQLPEGLNTAVRPHRAGETLSRRAFFSTLARGTTGAAASVATAKLDSIFDSSQNAQPEEAHRRKKGDLPVRLPAKQRLLLAALRQLGKPVIAGFEADSGPWAQFGFEETCTGCQMCAFFCPTGALSKIEEGGKAGVAFRISFCTNCRLCQDICYKQAVLLAPGVDLSQILSDAVDTFLMRDVDATPWSTNRF